MERNMAKKTLSLNTIEEAVSILDYFNGFHDGFIKRLTVKSPDEFKDWGHQLCMGGLSLEIIFAHYNYAAGERPHTQLVKTEYHWGLPTARGLLLLRTIHRHLFRR